MYCGVFSLERDGVTYWFVDNEYYFKRWQLYGHFDDCERFAFFSRAVIETPGHFGLGPGHHPLQRLADRPGPGLSCWRSGTSVPELANTKTVFTIHNIEYQGRYGDQVLEDVIRPGPQLSQRGDAGLLQGRQPDEGRHHGLQLRHHRLAHLRPGAAVLPFYAHGLDGVINEQSGKLQGILNGIDTAAL